MGPFFNTNTDSQSYRIWHHEYLVVSVIVAVYELLWVLFNLPMPQQNVPLNPPIIQRATGDLNLEVFYGLQYWSGYWSRNMFYEASQFFIAYQLSTW